MRDFSEAWSGSFRYRCSSACGEVKTAPLVSSSLEDRDVDEMPRVRLSTSDTAESRRVDVIVETREALTAEGFSVSFRVDPSTVRRIFANGFQSWTESREWTRGEWMKGLGLLLRPASRYYRLHNYGDYTFTSYPWTRGRFHGYTYFYFVRGGEADTDASGDRTVGAEVTEDEPASQDAPSLEAVATPVSAEVLELWGSLDESNGYTRFTWDWKRGLLTVDKECEGLSLEGGELLLSLGVLTGPEENVFDRYFSCYGVRGDPEPKAGWCSWYRYYTGVTERDVRENLAAFRSMNVPIEVFQIDDGWEQALGDWMEVNDSFPSGMAALAAGIREAGYEPGLWLAPFVVAESSQLFREHPDWCIKDEAEDPLLMGINNLNWDGRFYALDPLFPQVYEYLRRVFRTVFSEWGYSFLKLDFLYTAAIVPREGKSRGRIMFEAMRMLREFAGENEGRTILGCGVPIGSAFGFVDYCRIGADVTPAWEHSRLAAAGYRERMSTISSLRSTIGRRHLSGRAFGNDPDVYVLRNHEQKMSFQQRRSLYLVNQIYGRLLLTSDNPVEYEERSRKLYLSQFPLLRSRIEAGDQDSVLFRRGDRRYRACHNLGRKRISIELPEGLYYGFEVGFFSGGPVSLGPYETRVYLEVDVKPYAVAGSTGLLFPGSEITDFSFDQGKVSFNIRPGVLQEGTIFLKVPGFLKECEVNGTVYPCEEKVDMSLVVVPRPVTG